MPGKFDLRYRLGCGVFGLVLGHVFGFALGLGCLFIACAPKPLPVAVFGTGLLGALLGLVFPSSIFALWDGAARAVSRASEFFSKHQVVLNALEVLCCAGVLVFVFVMLFIRG
jgi:hypothetical protein